MLQEEVFAVLFMNELKNLTNVVIGKLGKLVHKQDCSRDFYFYFMNYNITIVRVRYITIETKKLSVMDITGFFFGNSHSGGGIRATHLGLHLSTLF